MTGNYIAHMYVCVNSHADKNTLFVPFRTLAGLLLLATSSIF